MCEGTIAIKPTCPQCGNSFTPSPFTTVQKYCSKSCADKFTRARRMKGRTTVCKNCGVTYHPKEHNRLTYCSRECGWAAKRKTAEARSTAKRLRKLYERLKSCRVCRKTFLSKGNHHAVCSDECRLAEARGTGLGCVLCGNPRLFVGRYHSSYCETCREEVKRTARKKSRWSRDRRKAEQTTGQRATLESSRETLNLLRQKIARARGQCKLCGLAMSKQCDPNNDRALEFDHKVPLALGGSDSAHNIQAICRRCNRLKGVAVAPDVVIGEWCRETARTAVAH